jgi:hypothetical protein
MWIISIPARTVAADAGDLNLSIGRMRVLDATMVLFDPVFTYLLLRIRIVLSRQKVATHPPSQVVITARLFGDEFAASGMTSVARPHHQPRSVITSSATSAVRLAATTTVVAANDSAAVT